ncbi:MAG: signal peptidase I [Gloeomargaritaceae cyanobacterium C42_A2020_066]|nr:signal peptidase I [Gloeomargaritaceae cyanobacterium C42_A2020_066]
MTAKHSSVPPSPPLAQQPWWRRLWDSQRDTLQTLVLAVLLAFVIRGWVAEPRYIPSASMVPTLGVGDRLVVEKLSYHFHEPRRGDIVVFSPPPALQAQGYRLDDALIKRVVGLPGDRVEVVDGYVWINGRPLVEPYLLEAPHYTWGPYEVPEGCLAVFGDNRNNSNDSHVWGFLSEDAIVGRAWVRFWPPQHLGRL